MTTRNTPFDPGTPCWVELLSSDVAASRAFYAELFGWTAEDAGEEYGGYVNFLDGGDRVAGMIGGSRESGSPDAWTTYISTSDVDTTAAAVIGAGGHLLSPPRQVADLGTMAIAIDPVGAVFGLWQPGSHIGFTKYNEPTSVTWDEHHSKDFATSTAFYTKVFGWHMDPTSDTDQFRYFQGQIDGYTVVGLMDSASVLPDDVPSHWAVYFSVSDADATAAKSEKLGGSVIRPPEDTPFGRIADLRDATGANFKLHSIKLAGET